MTGLHFIRRAKSSVRRGVSTQGLAFLPSQPLHMPDAAFRALEASIHKDFVALKAHLPLREDGIMEAFVSPPQYPCGGFLPEGEIWEKKAED